MPRFNFFYVSYSSVRTPFLQLCFLLVSFLVVGYSFNLLLGVTLH